MTCLIESLKVKFTPGCNTHEVLKSLIRDPRYLVSQEYRDAVDAAFALHLKSRGA